MLFNTTRPEKNWSIVLPDVKQFFMNNETKWLFLTTILYGEYTRLLLDNRFYSIFSQ